MGSSRGALPLLIATNSLPLEGEGQGEGEKSQKNSPKYLFLRRKSDRI